MACIECKDCIHNVVCGLNKKKVVKECEHFKNKSLVVKLPCKIGTPVFIINKKMGCVYNGKFRLDDIDQFGRRVFLTKADAVKAVKGV